MDQADARTALKDPTTPAAVIADVAYQFPDMRAEVAAHPGAYPGLLDWLDNVGDAGVKAAVSARRTADAAPASNEPADVTVYKPLEPTPAGPAYASYSAAASPAAGYSSVNEPTVPAFSPTVAPTGPAYSLGSAAEQTPAASAYVPAPTPTGPAPTVPAYSAPSEPTVPVYGAPSASTSPAYAPAAPAEPAVSTYTPATAEPDSTPPMESMDTPPAPTDQQASGADAPSAGFAVLGFFVPVVGLILYLMWKRQTPLKARSAGKGALISVIVQVVLYIIGLILFVTGVFALGTTTGTASTGPAPATVTSSAAPAVPPSTSTEPVAPPTSAAPVPQPTSAAPIPSSAPTTSATKPASSSAAAFGIGTPYSGKCTVAWPTAPVVTSTTIQMTMSCTGIPSQYLLVVVVYADPTLNVTPSTGAMSVTGVVADFAQSQAGMTVPVIQATSINLN